MNPLVERLQRLSVDAELELSFRDFRTQLRAAGNRIVLDFPDVATAWSMATFMLPRRRRWYRNTVHTLRHTGFSLELHVRGACVIIAGGRSGWPRLLGFPHLRLFLLTLLRQAIAL